MSISNFKVHETLLEDGFLKEDAWKIINFIDSVIDRDALEVISNLKTEVYEIFLKRGSTKQNAMIIVTCIENLQKMHFV